MRRSFAVPAKVEREAILDALYHGLTQPQLLQFIKDLDDRVCDLAFTKKLAKHFFEAVEREKG